MTVRARSMVSVGLASIVTGVLAYATLIAFARIASETSYVAFAVLWAAYYGLAAAFSGLQQDLTRAVLERPVDGVPLWRPAALVVGGASALTAGSAPWWGRGIGVDVVTALVLAAALCSLGGLVVALAVLAADRDWRTWARLLVLDSVVRLGAVTAAALADAGLAWQVAAIGSGSLVWPGLALSRGLLTRRVASSAGVVSSGLTAMSATASAALVVAGMPLLAVATTGDELDPTLAGLLAGLVLFRSPVLLVVNAYRPMLVVQVAESDRDGSVHVWRLWRLVLLGGAVAAAAAYVAGPWLLAATWGPGYEVSRVEAGLLVLSAVVLTLITVSSTSMIAEGRPRTASLSWLLTVVVSVVLLLLPVSDANRILLAAVAGPLPTVVWHSVLLRARVSRDTPKAREDQL